MLMNKTKSHYKSGQFTLMVVLAGLVILTVGLGLIARITVDTRISSQSSDALQALYAAESGIEYAYNLPVGTCNIDRAVFDDVAEVKCEVNDLIPLKDEEFSLGTLILGSVKTVWFVGHSDFKNPNFSDSPYVGGLTIRTSSDAVLGLTVFYDKTGSSDYAAAKFVKVASQAAYTLDSLGFDDRWFFLRIKLISTEGGDTWTNISITPGSDNFPSQGKEINSLGTVIAGRISKRIIAKEFYPSLPSFFDYVILSRSGINP